MSAISIIDTTLLDAQEALWAGRLEIEEVEPILESLDMTGYGALQVWGGESYEASLRKLGVDPWQTLRFIKARIKRTPLQAFLRSYFLVGRIPCSLDIIAKFIEQAAANGIDIFRIYDPLNNWENMQWPIKLAHSNNCSVQGVMLVNPIPEDPQFEHLLIMAERLATAGVETLCLMDCLGVMTPHKIKPFLAELRKRVDLPCNLHIRYGGAVALATCLSAAEAGIESIDTAAAPLSFGPSLPPVETVSHCLRDGGFETGIDPHRIFNTTDFLEEIRRKHNFPRGLTKISSLRAAEFGIPATLLAEIEAELAARGKIDLLLPVLAQIRFLRQKLGCLPLVGPLGSDVAKQALDDLLDDSPSRLLSASLQNYVRGLYGDSPAVMDESWVQSVGGRLQPVTGNIVDYLPFQWETLAIASEHSIDSGQLLSRILFPELAPMMERVHLSADEKRDEEVSVVHQPPSVEEVTDLEAEEEMKIDEIKEILSSLQGSGVTEFALESGGFKIKVKRSEEADSRLLSPNPPVSSATQEEKQSAAAAIDSGKSKTTGGGGQIRITDETKSNLVPVTAPIVGRFYRSAAPGNPPFVEVGTRVSPGDTLCIVEAMKVMNEVAAEIEGMVVEILVENGKAVEYGQPLMLIAQEVTAVV